MNCGNLQFKQNSPTKFQVGLAKFHVGLMKFDPNMTSFSVGPEENTLRVAFGGH